jgi:hypothetical protein
MGGWSGCPSQTWSEVVWAVGAVGGAGEGCLRVVSRGGGRFCRE